jgi:outer membrane protein assembly factor BamA
MRSARAIVASAVISVTLVSSPSFADDVDRDEVIAIDESEPIVEDPAAAEEARRTALDDVSFGPLVTIERIVILGNSRTSEKLIRRALLVEEGEQLRAGDPRFRVSRFRVLALGYFVDAELRLAKGSTRGTIVLTVEVYERGTFTINRIYLGASEATPIWAGLDLGDASLFGTGVGVGAAFVWADRAEIEGAREQTAIRLRVSDPSPFGLPMGVHATGIWSRASEPYRVMGPADDGSPELFRSVDVDRAGGVIGVQFDLSRLSSLILDARYERIEASLAGSGIETDDLDDLIQGTSHLTTIAIGFERDTRPDPILPYAGDRVLVVGESGKFLPGDWEHVRLRASYQRWFPVKGQRHVVSLHVTGGVILGDAPRFDRFYLGDFDPLLSPRALDLVTSTRPPPDFLGTGAPDELVGDIVGAGGFEYSYRLFRGTNKIYGGDLFAGVGLVSLRPMDGDRQGLALDLTFNAGLRLDTEVGVFELSLGNALGRIPW